jgi:hypothetical protein
MKMVKLSDDPIIRNIQYALVCRSMGCLPYIVDESGSSYLEVPDELYDKVLMVLSTKPKVIVKVRFPAKLLTSDTFIRELGVEPLHIFYSPEGIFTIAFDRDVNLTRLMKLITSLFTPQIEVV